MKSHAQYRRALATWLHDGDAWYPNWPILETHALGERGYLQGGSYRFEGPSGLAFDTDTVGPPLGAWTYGSSKNVAVDVGVDVQAPGFDFLGNANAGITASFGAAGDAYLSATGVRITRVADVAPLRAQLRARGLDGSFRPGTAIVLATLAAERALVMTARSHNTRFAARVRVNVPIAPAVPADLAGNLSVTRGAGTVDLQEYSVGPVVLALRLLILVRRGWMWWRHLNVQGVGSVADDERLELLEALADDDEFVIPLQ